LGYCYFDGSSKRCVVNATLQCESVIQQYQRAEEKLDNSVDTISGKVDTINNHIDKAIEDAPAKLRVSINVSDDDWQKIQEMLNKQREWLINQAQTTVQTVNVMLAEERTKVRDRYKEYDGCYLGHYDQWLFWFFFVLGYFLFKSGIVMMVGKWFNWF
jgi:fructose-1,6-bisphosphatase